MPDALEPLISPADAVPAARKPAGLQPVVARCEAFCRVEALSEAAEPPVQRVRACEQAPRSLPVEQLAVAGERAAPSQVRRARNERAGLAPRAAAEWPEPAGPVVAAVSEQFWLRPRQQLFAQRPALLRPLPRRADGNADALCPRFRR